MILASHALCPTGGCGSRLSGCYPALNSTIPFNTRNAKMQDWRDVIDGVETDAQLYKVVGWHKLGPRLKSPSLIIEGVQIEGTKEKAQALAQNIIQRFTSADDLEEDPLTDWGGA